MTKVAVRGELKKAFNYALEFSREKKVVIEEFFYRDGYQVAGDGFVVDGNLVFRSWANEHFDKLSNQFVPIGESFPSIMNQENILKAQSETQRLLTLLNMKSGALNFDFHFNKEGEFSFLELGPRNGGNLIPEVIKYATGVDLVKYTVDAALGMDCSSLSMVDTKDYYSSYILHALNDGVVENIWYSDVIKNNIVEENIFIKIGDKVKKFNGSHTTLGTMIMKFDSKEEMLEKMDNMEKYLKVIIKE